MYDRDDQTTGTTSTGNTYVWVALSFAESDRSVFSLEFEVERCLVQTRYQRMLIDRAEDQTLLSISR